MKQHLQKILEALSDGKKVKYDIKKLANTCLSEILALEAEIDVLKRENECSDKYIDDVYKDNDYEIG